MKLTLQYLEKRHEKSEFECGYPLLNEYIQKQAKQDISRDLSACFVLCSEQNKVYGYYTLSANSIRREDFPEALYKKLPPSYGDIPTILLGRLAVDTRVQGQGFGEILLVDALKRTAHISESLGSLAVVVDPIDEKAQGFYSRYGFILLPSSGKMFIPMKTIRQLFS